MVFLPSYFSCEILGYLNLMLPRLTVQISKYDRTERRHFDYAG